jgi:hypothetical protein
MSFISEYVLLVAVCAVAVLVFVSGLACREMQVQGDIVVPCLRFEPDQFQGMAMVFNRGLFIQVDTVEVIVVKLHVSWTPSLSLRG